MRCGEIVTVTVLCAGSWCCCLYTGRSAVTTVRPTPRLSHITCASGRGTGFACHVVCVITVLPIGAHGGRSVTRLQTMTNSKRKAKRASHASRIYTVNVKVRVLLVATPVPPQHCAPVKVGGRLRRSVAGPTRVLTCIGARRGPRPSSLVHSVKTKKFL